MTEVLVTGGTGVLGRQVVSQLLAAGHSVRVLSRQARPTVPNGVQVVQGDLVPGKNLDRAVAGVDAIVHRPIGRWISKRHTSRSSVPGRVMRLISSTSRLWALIVSPWRTIRSSSRQSRSLNSRGSSGRSCEPRSSMISCCRALVASLAFPSFHFPKGFAFSRSMPERWLTTSSPW